MLTRMLRAPAPTNIYALHDEYSTFAPTTSVSGRTQIAPFALASSDACFIVWGQSIDANWGVSLYTPTNADKVLQINPYDGLIYRLVDPVLGAGLNLGSWLGRAGDKLINAGIFSKVVFVPIARGGTSSFEWIPGSTGHWNHCLRVALLRVRALGWEPTAFLGNTGNTDNVILMDSPTYQANFAAIKASMAGMGYTGKWFISRNTMDGTGSTSTDIRNAQSALVNGVDVFAGPDYDSLTGNTNRQVAFMPHMTDVGYDALATLWTTALDAVF